MQKSILASLQEKTFKTPIQVINISEDKKKCKNPGDRYAYHTSSNQLSDHDHILHLQLTGSRLPRSSFRRQFLRLLLWIIAPIWTLTGMQAASSQSACQS